ncbi:MAG: helix-turn-helix domain-containing protein [Candidatus Binataceae bacterium]
MKTPVKGKTKSQVMTVLEVAEFLRCHEATVYRMLKRGTIPAFRVGADWRFLREQIEQWARAQSSGFETGGALR